MKTATLTETKNNLSALVDQVRNGETILILDRGRPVARLESALTDTSDPQGRLSRLERQGVLQRAAVAMAGRRGRRQPAPLKAGASGLDALLAERAENR